MKILKIALISIGVLIVVLLIAAVIFIKTFDVNRYKPQITQEASKALARKVDFQKINLGISLFQGISLKVSGLTIAEDPSFGKEDFLKVKDIFVGVDVLGYLLRRKISITGVLIDSPQVIIIRQQDGSINVTTISKPAEAGKEIVKSAPAAAAMAVPAILVSSIKSVLGQVIYIDNSFSPPLRLEAADLELLVSRVSLTESFPFVVEAAVLSAKKNIHIEGKARFDLKTNEVTVTDLKGATELANIILEQIPVVFPMAKGAVLPQTMKGDLNLTADKLIAGPAGLGTLAADGVLNNGVLRFKELAVPIQNIGAKVKITGNKISLEQVSADIGSGKFNGSGVIDDYLSRQGFSFRADFKDLKLEELIAPESSPVKAQGVVSGRINVNGAGFTPEALKSALSAEADLLVIKARLKDINILRQVLDKIAVIPGLSEKIEAGLPEKYKQKLTQKDTVLTDIKLPAKIENGRFIAPDISLAADEFVFKGSAEAGISGVYSLEGSFLIPQELSAAMVSAVGELQYLVNEDKQIFIPLRVSGKAPEMKFKPDVQYIAQKLLTTQAKQQIFKAIDKALGIKEPQPVQPGAAPVESSQKSGTEETVNNLLNSIFKKK